jgi:hypothetical protein
MDKIYIKIVENEREKKWPGEVNKIKELRSKNENLYNIKIGLNHWTKLTMYNGKLN